MSSPAALGVASTEEDAVDFVSLVISEAAEVYRKMETLTRESLLRLHSVFGSVLSGALKILDEGKVGERSKQPEEAGSVAAAVVVIRADTSGRTLWQVRGGGNLFYTLVPQSNFCPCPSWRYGTWRRKDQVTCKHILAARLALAFDMCQERVESEEEFVERMCAAMDHCRDQAD